MATPHHHIQVQHDPDNRLNPGGHPTDNCLNLGGHEYIHGHQVMTTPHRHNQVQHNPDNHLNPGGHPPNSHFNPCGHNDGRQVMQHQHQYNMHNVQESLTTRLTKLISAVLLSILFTVGLVTFILWLSLRPHRPGFHIHEFSILNLAKTNGTNGLSTAQITFNVTARNPNLDIGIYYDTMNLTLYYQEKIIAETPLLYPFYQSPKNTAIIHGTLSGYQLKMDNRRWMQLLAARKHGSVSFRLDVASSIRFKVSTWDSRRHKMHANCKLLVGSNGMILESDKEKNCPVYFT